MLDQSTLEIVSIRFSDPTLLESQDVFEDPRNIKFFTRTLDTTYPSTLASTAAWCLGSLNHNYGLYGNKFSKIFTESSSYRRLSVQNLISSMTKVN